MLTRRPLPGLEGTYRDPSIGLGAVVGSTERLLIALAECFMGGAQGGGDDGLNAT